MRWPILLLMGLIAACAPSPGTGPPKLTQDTDPQSAPDLPAEEPATLPNLGPAPELHNEIWLNTDGPLRLADLRGKVVLLDMWTFG